MKIKNVRAGMVIIADAGIKLAPGESVEVENPTRQVLSAIAGGILAHVDAEPASETKPKTKPAGKGESKKTTSPAATERQPGVSESESSGGDQGQLTGTGDGSS